MNMPNNQLKSSGAGRLDQDLEQVQKKQRAIGRRLRGIYDDTVCEGIPQEFEELLDGLRRREEAGEGAAVGRGRGKVAVGAEVGQQRP